MTVTIYRLCVDGDMENGCADLAIGRSLQCQCLPRVCCCLALAVFVQLLNAAFPVVRFIDRRFSLHFDVESLFN